MSRPTRWASFLIAFHLYLAEICELAPSHTHHQCIRILLTRLKHEFPDMDASLNFHQRQILTWKQWQLSKESRNKSWPESCLKSVVFTTKLNCAQIVPEKPTAMLTLHITAWDFSPNPETECLVNNLDLALSTDNRNPSEEGIWKHGEPRCSSVPGRLAELKRQLLVKKKVKTEMILVDRTTILALPIQAASESNNLQPRPDSPIDIAHLIMHRTFIQTQKRLWSWQRPGGNAASTYILTRLGTGLHANESTQGFIDIFFMGSAKEYVG